MAALAAVLACSAAAEAQVVPHGYHGRQVEVAVPEQVATVRLAGVREKQVARYWKKLADSHADQCIVGLDQQRRNLYLGDWGLLDLVRHLSAAVYPDLVDEQAVLSVYLLDAMHFDVRIGRIEGRLVMLVNTGSRLYDVPYVEVDSTRYYAFGQLPRKGKLHTYRHPMSDAARPINMHIDYSPRIGGELVERPYSYQLRGHKIEVRANRPLMDFYARYPQAELAVYATAAMEEAMAAALERELRPIIDGLNPVEALNALLELMQQGFGWWHRLSGHQQPV